MNVAPASDQIAGRSRGEWNAAQAKVESYFRALRVENRFLCSDLATRVIERAIARSQSAPERPAMELAADEMNRIVTEWFAAVLDDSRDASDALLATRGRLALLLAGMPEKWQNQFLKPAPWPDEFVRAMREAYLRTGPDFQLSRMEPRPLDLGPITVLTELGRLWYFRMALAWLAFAGLLVLLFKVTH
jgi:hypothetical protein